jgi:hypothetical protein
LAAFGYTFWIHRIALVVGTVQGTAILVGADKEGELVELRRNANSQRKVRGFKIDEEALTIIVS